MSHLETTVQLIPVCLYDHMICLESWFKFLGKEVSLPRLKKEPPPEPRIPTDNEIQKIWDYIEHIHDR